MAEPAGKRYAVDEAPTYDPTAVAQRYTISRARRRAKIEKRRARRLARIRFLVVVALLLGASSYLGYVIWREVERLFGL